MDDKKKILILLILLCLFFFMYRFTSLKNYLTLNNIRNVKEIIDKHPFSGPILFWGICSMLIMIGAPRAIIYIAGGSLFGFWKGLLLSTIAIITGSTIIFVITRYLGAPFFYNRLKKYLDVLKEYKGNQLIMVILVRQIPMPCLLNNVLLGLASISISIFIIGSLIAQLPTGIIFSLYGSSVHGNLILRVSVASLIAIIFFICAKYTFSKISFIKRFK